MGRPSKLTPDQWSEIERRVAQGEVVRSLAKEFGVDEAAIRRKFSPQTPQVRKMAEKLAEVQTELAALPIRQQHLAVNLAEKLRNISTSLACAAELGAKTSHRLQALANSQVAKVDDADPMKSIGELRDVGVLTKLANESAAIALNLLSSNRDAVQKMNASDDEQAKEPPPERQRLSLDEWKKAHGLA